MSTFAEWYKKETNELKEAPSDYSATMEIYDKYNKEFRENMKDETFLYDAIRYELWNHEYHIFEDIKDTLEELDLTVDELNENPTYKKVLDKAIQDYMKPYRS